MGKPDIIGLSEKEGKEKLIAAGIYYKEEVQYGYSLKKRGKIYKIKEKDGVVELYISKGCLLLIVLILLGMLIMGIVSTQVIPRIIEEQEKRQSEEIKEQKEEDSEEEKESKEDQEKETNEEDNISKEEENILKEENNGDIPIISLEALPEEIEEGEAYNLPSWYSFLNDDGEVSCKANGKEVKDTRELKKGTYKIECIAKSNKGKEAKAEKEIIVTEEWDLPQIDLDEVPMVIEYGEEYILPSRYSFGNDDGKVSCEVDGKKISNTKEMGIGEGTIICKAESNHKKVSIVKKKIRVTLRVGTDEIIDGWIRYNIYYPEDSYDWQWRLDGVNGIRTGYNGDDWQDYTGPILIKVEDIEKIYIRYKQNGKTIIIPPKGKLYVEIDPERWTLNANETTKVEIIYEATATKKEYRINGGTWEEYKGTFEVEVNTLIEARVEKNVDVYDNNGNYAYTQKMSNKDVVWISEWIENEGTNPENPGNPGGETEGEPNNLGNPGEPINPKGPSNPPEPGNPKRAEDLVLSGPIIESNPSSGIVYESEITIRSAEEGNIYYAIDKDSYSKYTGKFKVNKNCWIKAYYIRSSDGLVSETSYYYVNNIKVGNLPYLAIKATPNYLSEAVNEVEVEIEGSNYDGDIEYSLDGVIYERYEGSFKVERTTTVYAKASNIYGTKYEKLAIVTKTPPKVYDKLDINIIASPSKESVVGLINKALITIQYEAGTEKKLYKIGNDGEWQDYTVPFLVEKNTTIYAYGETEKARGNASLALDYLTEGISDPVIKADTKTLSYEVEVEVEYDRNAKNKKYRIDGSEWIDYAGSFKINENSTIEAYNDDVLGNKGYTSLTISNIINKPKYDTIDYGTYYLIKPNYPDTVDKETREYKWQADGIWKKYDDKGIVLIKQEYAALVKTTSDGIEIEDEQGKKVVFTDHYYVLDKPIYESLEDLYIRWNNGKPEAPEIVLETNEPTTKVKVSIIYASKLVTQKYKVVYNDGTTTGWLDYEGSFEIEKNYTTIYAKGNNRIEVESNIGKKTIENIDEIDPTITLKGNLTNPKQKVVLMVNGKDNLGVEEVRYIKGSHTKEETREGHIIPNNSTITITENGVYTFYVKDKVGREAIKEVTVENIDLNAPSIAINVLTTELSSEVEVEIDYGDSTTKQYSIGNNTNYQNYTGKITLKSLEQYNKANQDGSITIYAKGIDSAGNITEAKEIIYTLDIDIPASPIINASSGYPKITDYGITYDDLLTIIYDKTRDDLRNEISLDNGATWKTYTGYEHLVSGTVKARSITPTGIIVSSTKTVSTPSNALGLNAYDGNDSTYVYGSWFYIAVDSSMWNKKMNVYTAGMYASEIYSQVNMGTNKSSLGNGSGRYTITIPYGTNWLYFAKTYAGPGGWEPEYHEISVYTNPVINSEKIYPKITEYGIEQGYNNITIDYFNTSVTKEYKINDGEWQNYNGKIRLEIGDTIYARGMDKYGTITPTSSYTAVLPGDATGQNLYDGNESTLINSGYIEVDETMWNKVVTVYSTNRPKVIAQVTKGTDYSVLKEGGNRFNVTIPSGTKWLYFGCQYAGSNNPQYNEIYIYNNPVINPEKIYPKITEYGIEQGYNNITIDYFNTSVTKEYKINDGEWQNYNGKIRLEIGDTIYARGMDKYGTITPTSSYTAVLPGDALGPNSYDGNDSSYVYGSWFYMEVDSSMWNKSASIYTAGNYNSQIYSQESKGTNKNSLGSGSRYTITIPSNTKWLYFSKTYAGPGGWEPEYREISVVNPTTRTTRSLTKNISPIIESENKEEIIEDKEEIIVSVPKISIETTKENTKEISIEYEEGYLNEYSLDLGKTWYTYSESIIVEENLTIIARTKDKEGNIVSSSSFTITTIKEKDIDIEEVNEEETNNEEEQVEDTNEVTEEDKENTTEEEIETPPQEDKEEKIEEEVIIEQELPQDNKEDLEEDNQKVEQEKILDTEEQEDEEEV